MSRFNQTEEYIAGSSGLVCLSINADGVIIDANRSALELLSVQIGSTHFESLPVDFTNYTPLNQIKTDGSERYLYSLNTAGPPITLWLRFYAKDNRITAYGELDYNEMQMMCRVLVETNKELSNLARELEKKRIKLDLAVKERNQLIGMVAHDLRNPISNVQSLATLIQEDVSNQLDCNSAQLLDLIISQSSLTRKILDGMLDLSAIESGELKLNNEALSIHELFDYACILHKRQCEHKHISIVQHVAEALPSLHGDRVKFTQVLSNLISNAIKFSNPGTTITLLADIRESRLHIAVSDQGIGIPDDEKSKLFKPFSPLSSKPTAGESTTGLGLAIARKIIVAHGGFIEIESTLGQGTTVHIDLPISSNP